MAINRENFNTPLTLKKENNKNVDEFLTNSNTYDLGYLSGYAELQKELKNNDVPLEPEYNSKELNTNKMLSIDEDIFRYSLSDDYEDPTLLGFSILFKDNSPLFSEDKNSVFDFINKYQNIRDISIRGQILTEFKRIFNNIFRFDFNNQIQKQKRYYIESILGLNRLNAKMTKYKEDKLTITLTEDVSMLSLYLAELYNNLVYDYKNQRYMIPENCLRFDMIIKIYDYRDFIVPNNLNNPATSQDQFSNQIKNLIINENISQQIYVLRDCNFDFFNSQNHLDNLTMAGYNTVSKEPANLSFDIYYKSVERETYPLLLNNRIILSNKKTNLINNDAKTNELFKDLKSNDQYTEINTRIKKSNSKTQFNPTFINETNKDGKKGWWSQTTDVLKSTTAEYVDNYKDKVLQKIREKRGELLNNLLNQIRGNFNVPPIIYPDNVYDPNFYKLSLENFAKGLATNLYNNAEDSIQSGVNEFFKKFGI